MENVEKVQTPPDTSITNLYERLSFKKDDGRFLKYFCEGENLFIQYGNNTFNKVFKDTFVCIMPYVGTPMLWAENKERILLSFGCGSPCWGVFELSFNQKDTVKSFLYHYDYDEEIDVLIHVDYYEPKDRYVLMARNLSTAEYQVIDIGAYKAPFIGYYIDSLSFENKELFVRLRTEEDMKKGMSTRGSRTLRRKVEI
ncbi:MAG: hypothetical protein AAF806_32540 [Bacteroidota bacterium]